MKKLLIILACLSLIFMASNNLIASGGGGGGGGGNGDNNYTGPPLFPSKPQEKQATEGAKQDPKEVQEPPFKFPPPQEREPPHDFFHRAFCFIDTASQNSLLDELLNFVWKPKSE